MAESETRKMIPLIHVWQTWDGIHPDKPDVCCGKVVLNDKEATMDRHKASCPQYHDYLAPAKPL